jgi:hypothetical protein
MAYIGNQPTSSAFVTDLFSGNGSTTVFTMSVAPANTASILIAISGVVQSPDTYSINATTLTFSAAPPAGTGNISVRYLGIPATNVTTTAYRTVTEFTATASQTTFSVPSYTVGYIDVYRNGVRLGTADYTATSGTSVVLANAATLGDLVATESFYVSSVLNAIPAAAGQVGAVYLANGAASQAFLDVANLNGTGALLTPSGNTAQRPASPAVGMQRWNTTIGGMEVYIGTGSTGWQTIASTAYSVDYLVVAGGGGGGGELAGGGGAGGLLTGSAVSVTPGTSYTITVGAGGAGGNGARDTDAAKGKDGSSSSFLTFTAIGGGGGGIYTTSGGGRSIGNAGGSGGGGGGSGGGSTAGGTGTVGQGNAGGAGYPSSSYPGGGGGGAGGVGGNYKNTADGGNGGPGATNSITGTITYYAGGGGGSSYLGVSSTGGLGGGGAGNPGAGSNGGANTGGGGGGGGYVGAPSTGGSGGSGIVIIRYLGSVQRATGGTVTITGGYVIHTFTTSGTYIA